MTPEEAERMLIEWATVRGAATSGCTPPWPLA